MIQFDVTDYNADICDIKKVKRVGDGHDYIFQVNIRTHIHTHNIIHALFIHILPLIAFSITYFPFFYLFPPVFPSFIAFICIKFKISIWWAINIILEMKGIHTLCAILYTFYRYINIKSILLVCFSFSFLLCVCVYIINYILGNVIILCTL